MITFLQQTWSEILKVSFPTRDEIIRLTLLVIAISVIVGLYLGALDFLFLSGLQFLVK